MAFDTGTSPFATVKEALGAPRGHSSHAGPFLDTCGAMARVAVIRCDGCGLSEFVPLAERPKPFEPCKDCDGWREIVRIISQRQGGGSRFR
jgi:hypothetical protein